MKDSNFRLLIAVILFIALSLALIQFSHSQNGVYLSVSQDVKHATYDEDAFRLNLLGRVKLEGFQQKYGYILVAPSFEYADLKEAPFTRFSFDVGYVFNKLFIKNLEVSGTAGWGFIQRGDSFSYASWSFVGDIGYVIVENRFKIVLEGQFTERSDIGKWVPSTFLGIEVKLF